MGIRGEAHGGRILRVCVGPFRDLVGELWTYMYHRSCKLFNIHDTNNFHYPYSAAHNHKVLNLLVFINTKLRFSVTSFALLRVPHIDSGFGEVCHGVLDEECRNRNASW
jgi:hypothetical protein